MLTTNQIWSYLESTPNFKGVYPCDAIPPFTQGSIIVNTDKKHEDGEHWVALYLEEDKCLYFDSFGVPVLEQSIFSYLNKRYDRVIYNKYCIQDVWSTMCGHYCIGFVKNVTSVGEFDRYVSNYDFVHLKNNENIVLSLM